MVTPDLVAVADPSPTALAAAVARHGFTDSHEDWRRLVADERVDVVSVTAPNAFHREIGVAVAQAGKQLWIEKPVGLSAADARAVRDAVSFAGVAATVGFNYRVVPGVIALRDLVRSGAVGQPTHALVRMLTDYAAHPLAPLSWRFTIDQGGRGVLGDLASHAVDLVRFAVGDIASVVAVTGLFIPNRPLAPDGAAHYSRASADSPVGPVENEDYVSALLRTRNDVLVVLECSRVAVGNQNNYALEVHGTRGFVSWDFRNPGEIVKSYGVAYSNQPAERYVAGPGDGDYGRFQPGSGIAMGYDDTKVIELAAFVRRMMDAEGDRDCPTLDDAVASAETLDAMARSADGAGWVDL